ERRLPPAIFASSCERTRMLLTVHSTNPQGEQSEALPVPTPAGQWERAGRKRFGGSTKQDRSMWHQFLQRRQAAQSGRIAPSTIPLYRRGFSKAISKLVALARRPQS